MIKSNKYGSAIIFESPDQPLKMTQHQLPVLNEGEVLVEVEMTSLCTSDLLTIRGKRQEPAPLILGHESIGFVSQLPNETVYDMEGSSLQVGDRVSWSVFSAPAESTWARKGMRQKSPGLIKYGHRQLSDQHFFSGGLASHCHLLADTCILKIPSAASAASFCPVNCSLATVVGGYRLAGEIEGRKILITGGGMLGVYACALARTLGAHSIVVSEPLQERRDACLTFGADEVCLPEEIDASTVNGYDITLDTSGQRKAMQLGLSTLAVGGTAVWLGAVFPQQALPLDTEMVVRKLITIKGLHNYNEVDFKSAIDFMKEHYADFPFDSLVAKTFALKNINEAISYAKQLRPFRVALIPGSD